MKDKKRKKKSPKKLNIIESERRKISRLENWLDYGINFSDKLPINQD